MAKFTCTLTLSAFIEVEAADAKAAEAKARAMIDAQTPGEIVNDNEAHFESDISIRDHRYNRRVILFEDGAEKSRCALWQIIADNDFDHDDALQIIADLETVGENISGGGAVPVYRLTWESP